MKTTVLMAGLLIMSFVAMAEQDKPKDKPKRDWGAGAGMRMMDPEQMSMRITKDLDLTKEQSEQLKAIQSENMARVKELTEKMKEAAKSQVELMSKDDADEAAILKAADEIATIRAEIGRIRLKQLLAARKILTPEQRTKMRELMNKRLENRPALMERKRALGGSLENAPKAQQDQPKAE